MRSFERRLIEKVPTASDHEWRELLRQIDESTVPMPVLKFRAVPAHQNWWLRKLAGMCRSNDRRTVERARELLDRTPLSPAVVRIFITAETFRDDRPALVEKIRERFLSNRRTLHGAAFEFVHLMLEHDRWKEWQTPEAIFELLVLIVDLDGDRVRRMVPSWVTKETAPVLAASVQARREERMGAARKNALC